MIRYLLAEHAVSCLLLRSTTQAGIHFDEAIITLIALIQTCIRVTLQLIRVCLYDVKNVLR